MMSDVLTCRCRHCGHSFPYLQADAGAQAECPQCRNSVILPGKLRGVAAKRRARVNTRKGLALEIAGFLLLFWWPYGTIPAAVLIYFGWKTNNAWRCTNCEAATTQKASRCSSCGCAFSSE